MLKPILKTFYFIISINVKVSLLQAMKGHENLEVRACNLRCAVVFIYIELYITIGILY